MFGGKFERSLDFGRVSTEIQSIKPTDCFQCMFELQFDQKCISASQISYSFFPCFLFSSLPPHQAAISEQRIFLSSWRNVGDQESCHPEQQEQVEEVQWRGCWSRLRAEKISNQEENSTFKSNWKLPGDARAVWPPGPGPPLLLLGIQR